MCPGVVSLVPRRRSTTVRWWHGWRRPQQHSEALGVAGRGHSVCRGRGGVPREHTANEHHDRVQRVRGPGRGRRPSEELRAQRAAHPRQSGQGRGSAWCTRGGPRPPVPGLLLLWVRESRRLHRWGAPSPSDSAGSRHQLRLGHPHCRPAGCILGGSPRPRPGTLLPWGDSGLRKVSGGLPLSCTRPLGWP